MFFLSVLAPETIAVHMFAEREDTQQSQGTTKEGQITFLIAEEDCSHIFLLLQSLCCLRERTIKLS